MTVSLPELARIARRAGDQILSWYAQASVPTHTKADQSPVTQADLAAHAELAASLPRLLPGVPVISEESVTDEAATIAAVAREACFWLVDPMDGTRDFLARSGEFTVNVALMIDGRPTVGCVLAPVSGVCYLAANGEGAFRQDAPAGPLRKIATRKSDPQRFVCLVSRSHGAGEGGRLARAYPDCVVKSAGSSLKYALIAAGEADLTVRETPTSLWDTAAAQCLLEEAGGALLDFQGAALTYRTGKLINPPFLSVGDRSFDWRSVLDALR